MKPIFLGFFSAFIFHFYAQSQINKYSSSTFPHKQIYLYLGDIGQKSDKIIEQYNIKNIFIIGGSAIDPHNKGSLDEQSFQNDIERVIPGSNATGIAILDWEGKGMEQLSNISIPYSEFSRILDEYKKALRIAKDLRPEIMWGIYALPFRNYWSRNDAWKNRSFMLKPLLNECDVITPSVYDIYPDSLYKNENKLYTEDNVRLALEIGEELHKPVLPFVTHRLPNSKLILKGEFISHIDYIFKTTFLGKHVDGIIWWGPDEYYYSVAKDKVVRNEVGKNQVFSHYFDNLIYDYLSAIVQLCSFKN